MRRLGFESLSEKAKKTFILFFSHGHLHFSDGYVIIEVRALEVEC